MSAHPLLQAYDLPPSLHSPEHVKPAIERILADNRAAIARLLETQASSRPGRAGAAMDELMTVWAPPGVRSATSTRGVQSAELREALMRPVCRSCRPTPPSWGRTAPCFEACRGAGEEPRGGRLRRGPENHPRTRPARLPPVRHRLAGGQAEALCRGAVAPRPSWVAVSPTSRSTPPRPGPSHARRSALAGLTDSAKAQMKQAAEAKGLDGWPISLEFPSLRGDDLCR
ncbi:hypothetical protein ACPA9J_14970 [Pseudomonas aeruginosa]